MWTNGEKALSIAIFQFHSLRMPSGKVVLSAFGERKRHKMTASAVQESQDVPTRGVCLVGLYCETYVFFGGGQFLDCGPASSLWPAVFLPSPVFFLFFFDSCHHEGLTTGGAGGHAKVTGGGTWVVESPGSRLHDCTTCRPKDGEVLNGTI